MPELPEVETIRRGLERYLIGKAIASIDVRVPKLFTGDPADITGAVIQSVERRAKVLIINLSNHKSLLIHLKMTGQLVYQSSNEKEKIVGGHPQAAYNQVLPHKHSHVIFHFNDGSTLYFNDLRKFGWIQIVLKKDVESTGILASVGPEPLDESFTFQLLRDRLMRYPNRFIFISLLDQSLVAGLGNIYVNEVLYEARIRPERIVTQITKDEWRKLWQSIRHVLESSIKYGGTSDSTYVSVEGKRGNYLAHAHVYHQKIARPCGHEVVRKKIGGRTAHYCPIDQI
jgi:formamidopyrimidine-DNA glycosylase